MAPHEKKIDREMLIERMAEQDNSDLVLTDFGASDSGKRYVGYCSVISGPFYIAFY